MKKSAFIIILCCFISFLAFSQANKTHKPQLKVFLLAGQSNMVGYGDADALPDYLKKEQNNVQIYVFGNVKFNWGNLRPGLGKDIKSFGPEIAFGNDVSKKLQPVKIAIIKGAWGGTNIDQEWRPPSSGGKTGKLYLNFIDSVKIAIKALSSEYEIKIAGMCWMQGEADALDTNMAINYRVNLTNFIKDIRKEFKVNDMPFIISMIDKSKTWIYSYTVRNAEIAVAKEGHNISAFDTHGYPTNGVHYYAKGVIQLGSDLAASMLKYFK